MTDSPSAGFTSAFDPSQSEPSFRSSTHRRESSLFGSPASTVSSGPVRLPLRTNPSTTYGTPTRKRMVVIRSDPTLITCFNRADKELYDLWAPKSGSN